MPPRGPRRDLVGFRLAREVRLWLDGRATEEGLSRSQMIRLAIAYAGRMPKGWRPRS